MAPRSHAIVPRLVATLTVALLLALLAGSMRSRGAKPVPDRRTATVGQAGAPRADTTIDRIHDEVGIYEEEARTERWLQSLHKESGVDLRVMLLRESPEESIEAFATRKMRELAVGHTVDGRGLLFVYDMSRARLRVEVGAGLEHIVTDAFAGYLMRENAAAFFEDPSRNREIGLRTTFYMVNRRIREAAIGNGADQRAFALITNPARIAAGAGVTAPMAVGEGQERRRGLTYPEDLVRFSEQPTVADAHHRHLDWLQDAQFQTRVPLLTPASQAFFDRHPALTRAFADYLLIGRYGQQFVIHERGDLAMLVFTSTPFTSPLFFRRTPKGWQMDAAAEVANSVEWIGYRYTWTMKDSGDDFSGAFADLRIKTGLAIRIKGGDNRPLPMYKR
jgi:hypothetical protein